jgi:hypothetical protein
MRSKTRIIGSESRSEEDEETGRMVVAIAAAEAVTLTATAAGGPAATKQRVAITFTFHASTFVLHTFQAGTLERDRGRISDEAPNAPCRTAMRDGQKASVCNGSRWTLTGRQGTLTVRTPQEWVDPGSGGCGVAFGTWTVVRGTGQYARITGGGRSAYDAHCQKWYARHEGYLTTP